MQPFYPDPAPGAEPVSSLSADALRSPEDILERRRRRRWLLTLLLVVVAAVGLWFGVRPALHAVKAWQARRAAAEAERLTAADQFPEAKAKLQDALQLWRQEPAAQRAAAIFLTATGNFGEAAGFWKSVETARPLTRDEQRDYSRALLASGDFDAAEAHLHKAWPSDGAGAPIDWEIGLDLAMRRHHGPQAADLARRLLASPAATARERLEAARTLLAVGDANAQGQARDEIVSLAQDRASAESLEALVLLTRHPAASAIGAESPAKPAGAPVPALPTVPELIERLETHPLAKIQHRLLAIDLQIAQDPARRSRWIQTAMDRFAGAKDDASLATFGAWLYEKGEYARVLEAIPAARASGDRPLFFQRLDALGALGRWSEIQEAIQSGKPALDPMIGQMYLARCADKLDEPRARDAHWEAALDAAGSNPGKLIELGEYAGKNGAAGVAEKAFRAAVQAAPQSREAYRALISLFEAQRDTAKLRQTIATMLALWPEDRSLRNSAAYCDALLDERVPAALATARDLVRAEPTSLPDRTTLALAELRSGNALAALDAYEHITLGQTVMQPRQRAVYAAVLWATSYNQEARAALSGVPSEVLLPEEQALVAPMQRAATAP